MQKHKAIIVGNHITCTKNCNCRVAATLYVCFRNMICFSYIIVNIIIIIIIIIRYGLDGPGIETRWG
jgi:hypothetical protein